MLTLPRHYLPNVLTAIRLVATIKVCHVIVGVLCGCHHMEHAADETSQALSVAKRFLVMVEHQMGIPVPPLTNMTQQTSGKSIGPREFFCMGNVRVDEPLPAPRYQPDGSWALGVALMTEDEAATHLAACAREITILSSERIGPYRLVCTFGVTGLATNNLVALRTSFLSLVDNLARKVKGESYDHYWDENTWWRHNECWGLKFPDLTLPPQNPSPSAQ